MCIRDYVCFKQLSKSVTFQLHQQSIPLSSHPLYNTSSHLHHRYRFKLRIQNITKITKRKKKKKRFRFPGSDGSRVAHELHPPACNGIQRHTYSVQLGLRLSVTASNVVVVVVNRRSCCSGSGRRRSRWAVFFASLGFFQSCATYFVQESDIPLVLTWVKWCAYMDKVNQKHDRFLS